MRGPVQRGRAPLTAPIGATEAKMQTIDRNLLRPAAKFVAPHTADSWAFQCVKVLDDGRAMATDGYRLAIMRGINVPPGTWDFYSAAEVSGKVLFPPKVGDLLREFERRTPLVSADVDSAMMRRRIRAMVREARDGRRRARRMVTDSGATPKAKRKELGKLPKVSDPVRGILAPFGDDRRVGVFAADETGWRDPAVGIDLAFLDDALSLAPRGAAQIDILGELEPVRVAGSKGECWIMPCKR